MSVSLQRREPNRSNQVVAPRAILPFGFAATAVGWPRISRATAEPPSPALSQVTVSPEQAAPALALVLLVVFLVVLAFLIGGWIIVRSARRRRALTTRERTAPTPSEDVWAMHKLPADDAVEWLGDE